MSRVAIALGSNLGDREAHLHWAIDRLRGVLTAVRVSSFLETGPVDVPDPQPPYLNAVAVGETELPAAEVMNTLLTIEAERGRTRSSVRASRTLDLDLILYGDQVIDDPTLTVPHPRFRDRLFVLEPLAEVAPEMTDPVSGLTVAELLAKKRGPDALRHQDPSVI
jgi:2-amino-4-hydroxy-6-hydroxymethyldihydropteridine diphosphokinase